MADLTLPTELPLIMTEAGPQPTPPATLLETIISGLEAKSPGYTARLPGILIEDISSTDVAAVALCDSARIETINSLTPQGANAFLLNLLGQIYGVSVQQATNTSVQVVFTGPAGYVIPVGFLVGDNFYQYAVSDGGILQTSGMSLPLTCVATVTGSWAIPAGTVTQVLSSVPDTVSLTCSNPYPGTPGVDAQSESVYRSRVLAAGLASAQGMATFAKTLIANVPGAQQRLISIQQLIGGGWEVIVGGTADPYAVAYAIYRGINDVSSLTPSIMSVVNITRGPNCIVTTDINHGYSNGQIAYVNDILQGMIGINGQALTVTVINEKNFSTNFDSTNAGVYTAGGIVTPNFRNNFVTIRDYPDNYTIPFVSPPLQTVAIGITWNTIEINFVNSGVVAQLATVAIAGYVNTVPVGQPMNEYVMTRVFQDAVASVLPAALLTRLIFEVSINGVGTAALTGTGEFVGDPESYFYTDPTGSEITVTQG